jgi:hypothetical protein
LFKYEEKADVIHLAHGLNICRVDSCEKQMKNAIGKAYEGKLHSLPRVFEVRFDEGGADCLLVISIFRSTDKVGYQALLYCVSIKNLPKEICFLIKILLSLQRQKLI